jgi:ubiquinone/menaquinone biosynthesis C-methylase UbiE
LSEQVGIQTAQTAPGLQTETTVDISHEDVIELVTKQPSTGEDIRPYDQPEEDTVFPLEYAFHLLNGVHGRTVIDLGSGSGLNTVILARLGAQVISIDGSNSNLEMTKHRVQLHRVADRVTLIHASGCSIPIADGCADRVLCHSILQHTDPVVIARQIRRLLKPGGRAVFHEFVLPTAFRRRGPKMTKEYARALSRAVGTEGSFKEFWLTTGLLHHVGIAYSSWIGQTLQRFDAAVFRRFPSARSLASSFVWEARKES